MSYTVLIFDADGTLFDYDKAEKVALQRALQDVVGFQDQNGDTLKRYRQINHQIWEDFENGMVTAENLKTLRFQRLFELLQWDIDPASFSETYLSYLGECPYLLQGAEDLLLAVYQNYTMVLLTNGLSAVQRRRIQLSGLHRYFPTIIISEEVGVAKPHTEIFAHTLQSIDHQRKEDVLMIGDGLKSDILGGYSFGVHTCWFNPEALPNVLNIKPTYEIQDLQSLLPLI